MKYQLVLFDLDGTLLDTIDDLCEAVNFAMRKHAFPCYSRKEIMTMVGHGVRDLITKALPEERRSNEEFIDLVLSDFKTYYTAHIDVYTHPFPGMQHLLSLLQHERVLMAVASNKFQEGTEYLINKFFPGISFVSILGNRPGFPLKPDPEIVGEILRKSGTSKEYAVMIGDSPTDMRTAENGGIKAIAVNWGYRNMKKIPGLTVVENSADLLTLLTH